MTAQAGGLTRALSSNSAATSKGHEDPRLRGRTYAVPFERVWRAVLRIVQREGRWKFASADDASGTIQVEVRSAIIAMPGELTVRIALDRNAQTRVDARAVSRKARTDLGMNARRIARLLRELDGELGVPHTAA
ncbi:MAG: DUF1499 domain-containing protein [Gemmatimonadota bacterium]